MDMYKKVVRNVPSRKQGEKDNTLVVFEITLLTYDLTGKLTNVTLWIEQNYYVL
jgi:hypothetical protein